MPDENIINEQTAESVDTPEPSSEQPGEPEGLRPSETGKGAAPLEISMDENGEIQLSDDFFEDMGLEDDSGRPTTEDDGDVEAAILGDQRLGGADSRRLPLQPYTDSELTGIPFERLDRARLPDAVKAYLPSLDEYHQRVSAEFRRLQTENEALKQQQSVSQPSRGSGDSALSYIDTLEIIDAKEIPKRARATAAERLGIKPEELDMYDADHQAELYGAVSELTLTNQRNAEARERYARDEAEYHTTMRELAAQPDFQEFDMWLADEMRKSGVTAEAINAEVERTGAKRQLAESLKGAYQRFKGRGPLTHQRGGSEAPLNRLRRPPGPPAARPTGGPGGFPPVPGAGAKPLPPRLESAAGGVPAGKKAIDMKVFSGADAAGQAEMLMHAGLV